MTNSSPLQSFIEIAKLITDDGDLHAPKLLLLGVLRLLLNVTRYASSSAALETTESLL